jgi:hypothetical protein
MKKYLISSIKSYDVTHFSIRFAQQYSGENFLNGQGLRSFNGLTTCGFLVGNVAQFCFDGPQDVSDSLNGLTANGSLGAVSLLSNCELVLENPPVSCPTGFVYFCDISGVSIPECLLSISSSDTETACPSIICQIP